MAKDNNKITPDKTCFVENGWTETMKAFYEDPLKSQTVSTAERFEIFGPVFYPVYKY